MSVTQLSYGACTIRQHDFEAQHAPTPALTSGVRTMPFDAPKVYSDEMLMFSGRWLGHPLWYPEPDSNGEVRIGDVGCIFQGRFRRLFNVLEARGAAQPQPKGFEPLGYNMEQGVDRRLRYLAPGTHASKTVTVIHGRVKGYVIFYRI